MLARQVTDRLQVSLPGQREAVERRDVSLVELKILLEEKAFVLVNAELHLLFEVEDRVHPIAVLHAHRVDVARLDHLMVNLGRLTHDMNTLASVLVYDIV